MKPTAAAKRFTVFTAFFHGLLRRIRFRAQQWAPIGYQDDQGFHLGDDSLSH